jgi:amino acid transporter
VGDEVTAYERLGEKRLTLVDVIAQSVGLIGPVFSAAFLIPLIAGASATGHGAGIATPFAVLLAAVGTFALGWIVAQYAKRVHAAGSLYDYVTMGLGQRVGSVAGWIYYGGTTVLSSAIAVLVGWFLHDVILVGTFGVSGLLPVAIWCLLYVAARFLVLYTGVELSTRTQLTLVLVSAVVVLLFSLNVIANAPTNSLRAFDPGQAPSFTGLFFGVLYGVLIFVGFETAANLAEETANPKRAIPRAVLLSVAIVTVYYLIAAYAQVAGFGFDLGVLLDPAVAQAPLFALGSPAAQGGYGGSSDLMLKVLEIVVFLDVMAVGLGAATASTRGIFAMARDRRIPGPLAAVNRRGQPVGSILFVEAFSVLMILFAQYREGLFALPGQPHFFALFAWLSTYGGFTLMIVYALTALGAFRGLADHANQAGVWVAALIGLVISVGAIFGGIYQVGAPFDMVWKLALIWIALGIVATLAVRGRPPAREVLSDLRG